MPTTPLPVCNRAWSARLLKLGLARAWLQWKAQTICTRKAVDGEGKSEDTETAESSSFSAWRESAMCHPGQAAAAAAPKPRHRIRCQPRRRLIACNWRSESAFASRTFEKNAHLNQDCRRCFPNISPACLVHKFVFELHSCLYWSRFDPGGRL